MSILSWNVRGINEAPRRREAKGLVRQHGTDLAIFLETKVRRKNFGAYKRFLGDQWGVASNAEAFDDTTPDSIWVAWDTERWEVTSLDTQKQWVHFRARNRGGLEIMVTAVYGASSRALRRTLWEKLIALGQITTEPWLVIGDFNEIRQMGERESYSEPRWGGLEEFNHCVNEANLLEIPYIGDDTTFCNGIVGEARVASRLDRALCNEAWNRLWPLGKVEHLGGNSSDHHALKLELRQLEKRKAPFRFTNSWVRNAEFKTHIEDAWRARVRGSAYFCLAHKLSMVKASIKRRNKQQGIINITDVAIRRVKEAEEVLAGDPESQEAQLRVSERKQTLRATLLTEEEDWRQRSRAIWLNLGDSNSKFFAAVTRERKSKNSLYKLVGDNGKHLVSRQDMEDKCAAHFGKLFGDNPTPPNRRNRRFIKQVTLAQNNELCRVPTYDEVKATVMELHPDKSPGPDGFNAFFFQKYWDIVGHDVSRAVRSIFMGQRILRQINHTFITLIPKKSGASDLADFRPIACVNTTYKILAKLIARRLMPICQEIVSSNQTAFIKGRYIGDNFSLATELVNGFNRASCAPRACIKVDISKAYDSVDWEALRGTLEDFGFDNSAITLLMECVTSTSFSVLVDGCPTKPFAASRGLRQGDPLSPYLFTILMENFTRSVEEKVQEGKLKLFKCRGCMAISHLAYADDLLLFCKATRTSLLAIKDSFKEFLDSTGLHISPTKSRVFFSGGTRDKASLAAELGFEEDTFPTRYLGMPLAPKVLSTRDCGRLLEVLENMMARWKAKLLSYAGRVQLINWGIMGNFMFWSASCRLPREVLVRIRSKVYNFIWDGRRDVAWAKMALPKREGGLGLRGFSDVARAAVVKRTWRIWHDMDSIWASWMRARYVGSTTLEQCGKRSGIDSAAWCEIIDAKSYTLACMDGRSHNWIGAGGKFSFKNAWETIRIRADKDPLAMGIWASQVSKHAFTLWRARWDRISTQEAMSQRDRSNPDLDVSCHLCSGQNESLTHLFFECSYSKEIWKGLERRTYGTTTTQATNLQQCMQVLNRLSLHSPSWGLMWSLLAATTWHIWAERNRRKHEARLLQYTEVLRRIISDVKLSFHKEKFKKRGTQGEEAMIATWEAVGSSVNPS